MSKSKELVKKAVKRITNSDTETPAEKVTRKSGTKVPSGEELASSQTGAPEFKPVTRSFKGDKVVVYLSCKHQYRVDRTNGKRDELTIKHCAKVLDIGTLEAEELLSGKFAIELDLKALTLEYNYTPIKKD